MAVEFVPLQVRQAQSPAMIAAWDELPPIGGETGIPDGTSLERSERGEVRRKSRSPAVVVQLSEQGMAKARESATSQSASAPSEGGEVVDLEDAAIIRKLEARDREVRQHEIAHKVAAGRYAVSGPHYQYAKGPDGRSYAVGGHVRLNVAPVPGDPEATVEKMRVIRRAALAPAQPSSSDRRIASTAAAQLKRAQLELQQERKSERSESLEASEPMESTPSASVDMTGAQPTAVV